LQLKTVLLEPIPALSTNMKKSILFSIFYFTLLFTYAQLGDDLGYKDPKTVRERVNILLQKTFEQDKDVLEGATVLYDAGLKEEAIHVFSSYLAKGYTGPLGGRMRALLGNLYDITHRDSLAKATYLEGIKLYPTYGGLYFELGAYYMLHNQLDSAINIWKQGAYKGTSYTSSFYYLSKYCQDKKRYLDALYFSEAYLILESENPKRLSEAATIMYTISQALCGFMKNEEGKWVPISEVYQLKLDKEKLKSEVNSSNISAEVLKSMNILKILLREEVIEEQRARVREANLAMITAYLNKTFTNDLPLTKGPIKIEKLAAYREAWAHAYVELGYQKKFPNPFMELILALEKDNQLENYLGSCFSEVNDPSIRAWHKAHPKSKSELSSWFTKTYKGWSNEKFQLKFGSYARYLH
jgi:hypothetical protein